MTKTDVKKLERSAKAFYADWLSSNLPIYVPLLKLAATVIDGDGLPIRVGAKTNTGIEIVAFLDIAGDSFKMNGSPVVYLAEE